LYASDYDALAAEAAALRAAFFPAVGFDPRQLSSDDSRQQSSTPAAPVKGADMVDAIGVWHSEHKRFAHLLDFLDGQMAAFHSGEQPDYALMRDAVHYLHHYGDRVHHPREDVAFARLVEREPKLELTVNRLLQEHRVLGVAADALLAALDDVLDDVLIERTTVEAPAATYLVYYRHHLATEEREILPRAAELLTPADWAAVREAAPSTPDPLFGGDGTLYRALRDQIAHLA
jgi:hemerythrin-like domain-containing protein